jgi:hypothetical protein
MLRPFYPQRFPRIRWEEGWVVLEMVWTEWRRGCLVPRTRIGTVDRRLYGSHKRFDRWIRSGLCLIAGLDAVDAAEIVPEWAWPQWTGTGWIPEPA